MNIYVSNLSFNIQDEELKQLFTSFGDVSSAKVIMDKVTNRSRGFGFIEMSDDAAAQKAIAELDGSSVDNRTIKVNEARAKESNSRPARAFDDGGARFNNANSYNQNRY
ncbi:RNA-binding protein [Flavitalea sp. BT771]|uniref:RNA recognition motif domain-containing protein n=1 Tax=Flavitalea sp. BT771 TaxID=3063329 RepID=UPI0026E286F0|nr:RNA-binding protein [Flavitalea sp. BT771]MDO6432831.1 RNA-binding protein [Flavitalea sp. BT771]MDV6221893.1 RNA-binding protein [Flavitalea sp. BT771]